MGGYEGTTKLADNHDGQAIERSEVDRWRIGAYRSRLHYDISLRRSSSHEGRG